MSVGEAVVQWCFLSLGTVVGNCYCIAFRASCGPGAKRLPLYGAEQRNLVLVAGKGTSGQSTPTNSSAGEEGAEEAASGSLASFKPLS